MIEVFCGEPSESSQVFPLRHLSGLDAVVLLVKLEQHVRSKLVPIHQTLLRGVNFVKQLLILQYVTSCKEVNNATKKQTGHNKHSVNNVMLMRFVHLITNCSKKNGDIKRKAIYLYSVFYLALQNTLKSQKISQFRQKTLEGDKIYYIYC